MVKYSYYQPCTFSWPATYKAAGRERARTMNQILISGGERYGKLEMIAEVQSSTRQRRVLCKCECGNKKVIELRNIRGGYTKSCGCLWMKSIKEANTGEKSSAWKGSGAGYVAIHKFLRKHYGKPSKCENPECRYQNPKRFEWANISGKYLRDRSDYRQMCPSCHRKWDNITRDSIVPRKERFMNRLLEMDNDTPL